MRVAARVSLSDEQRQRLASIAQSRTVIVRFAQRARMILLAADGLQDQQVAARVDVQRQTVALWRKRYLAASGGDGDGIDALAKDAPRGGRRRTARTPQRVRAIVERTTRDAPPDGATHWSTGTMARVAGVSASTVGRVWREHGFRQRPDSNHHRFRRERRPIFPEAAQNPAQSRTWRRLIPQISKP